VHWKAADSSNELKTFCRFQRMTNYSEYK
jgi:hypothetical protein